MSSPAAAPGGGLRAAAWLAFALLVVVVFGAAFIRFAQGAPALEGAVDAARWSYRVAAIFFVLVIAGMTVLGWDALRRASRVVLGAQVALAVALTFLGRVTPSSDHPLVAFGNPLGGLALVGLAWWIVLAASPGPGPRRRTLVGAILAAAAFLALAAIVVWPVGIAAGLVVQLAATALLVAGITLLRGRGD
jgi:hypothetical protein